jgi:hypothetical protein
MTTEQLAIIVPAGALVAVAFINAWWQARISKQALDSQEQTNKQTLESQEKRDVRARVAGVYENMLEMVGWNMEVVNATKPVIGEEKPPAEPDLERVRRVQARIGVHGSREVKDILERWAKRRQEFYADAWLLDRMQKEHGDPKKYGLRMAEQWKKVVEGRTQLHAMVRELEDAVSAELRA